MAVSPSSSPTRTWHKQSGAQATSDATLPVRNKDQPVTSPEPQEISEPQPPTSDNESSPLRKKLIAKPNVSFKRSIAKTPTSRDTTPRISRSGVSKPPSKRKATMSMSARSAQSNQITKPLRKVKESTNSNSLSRYRKEMLGRHRRTDATFGRRKGFVTAK